MEEILQQLIGSLSHYLKVFIHPRWCRISSINSSMNFCRILAMKSMNRPTQYELVWRSLTFPFSCGLFSVGRLKMVLIRRAKHVCPLGGFGAVHFEQGISYLCSKELCATTAQTIRCNTRKYRKQKYVPHS